MAKVELMPGIKSISGRVGDLIFRTNKATGKVTVMLSPRPKKVKSNIRCRGNA
ncbi:MAG: hypothetical protein J6T80_01120 [Paludibacteraceae bacterium]|nr:hypothetical protein [Paludibacteraceae bacterium]